MHGPPLVTPDAVVPAAPRQASGPYSWSSALFGAGRYITGIIYQPAVPGLAYIRTDVGGAYRRDPGSSRSCGTTGTALHRSTNGTTTLGRRAA